MLVSSQRVKILAQCDPAMMHKHLDRSRQKTFICKLSSEDLLDASMKSKVQTALCFLSKFKVIKKPSLFSALSYSVSDATAVMQSQISCWGKTLLLTNMSGSTLLALF